MTDKLVTERLYAFIAEGEAGEGICAFQGSDGNWLPMIAADMKRVDELWSVAQRIAKASGKKITLLKEILPDDLQDD